MTATGLIVNPKSGKSSGKGIELANRLAGKAEVDVHVLDRFEQLDDALRSLSAGGVETLFVSSGDGTVQALQTRIAEDGIFEKTPALALLPHGTTNLTAAELGVPASVLQQIEQLICSPDTRRSVLQGKTRPTLRITNPADGRVRHGMFLGTGAVWQATRFCQEAVHKTGLKGDFATFATLAFALLKSLLMPARPSDPDRIDRPYDMEVRDQAGQRVDGNQLLLLTTTLNKLILGTKPFWGGKTHALRTTILPYPPPSIPRWLWPALFGPEDRTMPDGCVSFSSDALEIATGCPFVLDGEFFDPPQSEYLRVERGHDFTYLCGR